MTNPIEDALAEIHSGRASLDHHLADLWRAIVDARRELATRSAQLAAEIEAVDRFEMMVRSLQATHAEADRAADGIVSAVERAQPPEAPKLPRSVRRAAKSNNPVNIH